MTDRSFAAGGLAALMLLAAPADAQQAPPNPPAAASQQQPSDAGNDRRGEIEILSHSWGATEPAPESPPRYKLTQAWPSKNTAPPPAPADDQDALTGHRGQLTIDGSDISRAPARSRKPKEIVVVGSDGDAADTPATDPAPNGRLTDKPQRDRAGLLVPAVQKVREPPSRLLKPKP